MIIRAGFVLTMEGEPISDGGVVVSGNRIEKVARWDELAGSDFGEVIDLRNHVLLPGLINAHCHLDYTMLRGVIPPPRSFAEWIAAINEQKSGLTDDDYVDAIAAGFVEAQRFGTTSIVNLESFPSLIPRVPAQSMRTWWFAELIDVRNDVRVADVVRKLAAMVTEQPGPLARIGLAPHAPYTASAKLYAEVAEISRREKLPCTTHLAESAEEMEMFWQGSGKLFDLLKAIGRPADNAGARTPLGVMLDRRVLDDSWIVAHLNEITENDFQRLEKAPRFQVVHCPRSHRYFRHSRFQLQSLSALGFNISLGTDSLASNENLSLFAEMRELQRNEPTLSARQTIEMVTVNPARALNRANDLGKIQPGFLADIIAIPAPDGAYAPNETVVAFEGDVPWSMIDGRILIRS